MVSGNLELDSLDWLHRGNRRKRPQNGAQSRNLTFLIKRQGEAVFPSSSARMDQKGLPLIEFWRSFPQSWAWYGESGLGGPLRPSPSEKGERQWTISSPRSFFPRCGDWCWRVWNQRQIHPCPSSHWSPEGKRFLFILRISRETRMECTLQTNDTKRFRFWIVTSYSLPPQQLQVLWTLFSKFFATFPRGTCLLSIFRWNI